MLRRKRVPIHPSPSLEIRRGQHLIRQTLQKLSLLLLLLLLHLELRLLSHTTNTKLARHHPRSR
jgi:hypothetical protein